MTRQDQWKFLDRLRRRAHIKNELRRHLLKSVIKCRHTSIIQRYKASFNLVHLPRKASKTKVRNRCVISGRTWNVIRRAQYSRFVFRHKAYFSFIPGVRRACW